jgi:Ni/Fe-hydrogenase subunit HybB-like protein
MANTTADSTHLPKEVLVTGGKTYADVSKDVSVPAERGVTKLWAWVIGISGFALLIWLFVVGNFVVRGLGIMGFNQPNGWGTDITNFVFWVGIGHAGTLISAILFLFRQKWRTAINRAAEAMTLFAVITALSFPLLHTGRPWYAAYWLLPYPNQRQLWVNFRSPLLWDVFAVSTYFTISLIFWYVGLIPDLATMRDRATGKIRKAVLTLLSLGWRGSNKEWSHYEIAYLIFAGLSTPLVLSVHTIVSFDFAVSLQPGWHTTIFPPYFVAGAIFSGFAMVVTLMVIMREVFGLKNYITIPHLEKMNKIIMATGLMVGYAYCCEFFIAWYSGNPLERFVFINRALGPYWWAYWIMFGCNVFIPQVFWFKKMRTNIAVMFVISLYVNIGMWFERYVIVVTSLHRDFNPSSWGDYFPTWWDWGWTFGAFGLFFTMFLVFCRFAPTLAMSEIKGVMEEGKASHG